MPAAYAPVNRARVTSERSPGGAMACGGSRKSDRSHTRQTDPGETSQQGSRNRRVPAAPTSNRKKKFPTTCPDAGSTRARQQSARADRTKPGRGDGARQQKIRPTTCRQTYPGKTRKQGSRERRLPAAPTGYREKNCSPTCTDAGATSTRRRSTPDD